MKPFILHSDYPLAGDQPQAVETLANAIAKGNERLVLQGVTGSGKTFTMANLIAKVAKPTLVLSHNKTLAAQLYTELKNFFPENAVEFFISYYDYYQPEAYIPQTDTYIEKDAAVNEAIDRFRLGATNSLIARRDVIVVSSVSCIYGLGSPENYRQMVIELQPGLNLPRQQLIDELIAVQYRRNDFETTPGNFRVRGDTIDIFPSCSTDGIRVDYFGDQIDTVRPLDPIAGKTGAPLKYAMISPAKHFVMPQEAMKLAVGRIRQELQERLRELESLNKLVEAQRLQQRTEYDLEMLQEMGYCNGIENYSRHLSGRQAGEPPDCLLDYFPKDFLTIIDESHVTIPQLRAMYNGDQGRKQSLIDYGFRLPSAKDNRPLAFGEFMDRLGPVLFVSATPGPFEVQQAEVSAEQVIRPTGLLDPPVEVRPLAGQIDDLIEEVRRTAEAGDRALATTLTKRSAEDLSRYLAELGIRTEYLHSGVDALTRVQTLAKLRKGAFDCLVGVNLLREGLDLPEVALVAILDADKEGFLRSTTSLIQTAGRTARHLNGRVILYADHLTGAMQEMIRITADRRRRQEQYNREHGITPTSVKRAIREESLKTDEVKHQAAALVAERHESYDIATAIDQLRQEMLEAADALEFERAAALRDEIRFLQKESTPVTSPDPSTPPQVKRTRKRPRR
ncbi:MAG: excinuclease ABC subunit UvrB [Kiritimatiellia bacterium]